MAVRRPVINGRVAVMSMQARIKRSLKPLIFSPEPVPRVVRFGPAKGVTLRLSRLDGIQLELGLYETELNGVFAELAPHMRVIYDVGANAGYTTLLLGNVAPEAGLVSFEPDAATLAILDRNLTLNPSIASRVKVMRMAIGWDAVVDGERAHRRVLDDLVDQGTILPPDLIKIDVDGAELEVLTGATRTLTNHRPVVVLETHSQALEEACVTLLEGLGYGTRVVKNALWRMLWPELRPIDHNRWLVASPLGVQLSGRTP